MTNLYFCVFRGAAQTASGDPVQEDKIVFTSVSVQGAVLDGTGRKRMRVRVLADGDCFATWGPDPTALNDGTNGRPLAANSAEYFDIEVGHRIAAIDRT